MKLAEALQRRADLRQKIETIGNRMKENVLVQEGAEADYDVRQLCEEFNELMGEWRSIVGRIGRTNHAATDEETDEETGKTLADLLVEREAAKMEKETYDGIVAVYGEKSWRARGAELKIISTFKAKDAQKMVDDAAKRFRELDNKIQMLNWVTDLAE